MKARQRGGQHVPNTRNIATAGPDGYVPTPEPPTPLVEWRECVCGTAAPYDLRQSRFEVHNRPRSTKTCTGGEKR